MILVTHLSEANVQRVATFRIRATRCTCRNLAAVRSCKAYNEKHDDGIIDKVSRRHNKVPVYDHR